MIKNIFFSILLLNSLIICGQEEVANIDDTISVQFSNLSSELKFKPLPYKTIDFFQHYRPFNQGLLPVARMGNLGLGIHLYTLQPQDWQINSHLGVYQPYLFSKDSIKFYKMSRPFTQLSYENGSQAEQFFNVFHSQNLGEGLNLSFEYRRMTSEGFYIQQLTNHTQFNSTYNLQNKNGRYKSHGFIAINDIEAQENGGIILTDSTNETSNALILDVNLRNAQNQSRSQELGFFNEYILLEDSNKAIVGVEHEFDWNKSYRIYSDDTTDSPTFYDNYFYDLAKSADSTFTQLVANQLRFSFYDRMLSIGIQNEQIHYYQNSFIDERLQSNFISLKFNKIIRNQTITLEIEKGISGFHKNEFQLITQVKLKEWKGIYPKIKLELSSKQPDYLFSNQRTNHFYFDDNFTTSKAKWLSTDLNFRKIHLNVLAELFQINDYIYYDSSISPIQKDKAISGFSIRAQKRFNLTNHIKSYHQLRFQQFSNLQVVPLPQLTSYNSIYYENLFFKKSLLFQLGTDIYYIGKSNGYQYSPALASFHINTNSTGLGNSYQIDLFIKMRVNKSFRILLKMENLTAKIFSEDTYRIQDYPIPGKALKVGLSWRMIN